VPVARLWLAPLFGHSMAAPPEAAASLTTARGAKVLWPERLSSSTARLVPPLVLLEDELELLELEELDELLLEEELELLLELDELDELLLDEDDEVELLELDEMPPKVPAEAVSVTRSSLAPSSLREIRKVCVPAATLVNVAGVMVP
jgi:hypothetical protein